MKKIAFLITLALFIAAAGCDKVKVPNPNPAVLCTLHSPVIKTNAGSISTRRILLEDYTGHTCGNCPRAARKAEALVGTYGSQIIVVANHVSPTFAAPVSDTAYREDFRNPNGGDWDVALGMSSAGLPRGGINRTTPYPQSDAAWASVVATAVNQPQSAKLEVTTYYDTVQRYLNVAVKTTFLKAFSSNIMLSLILTQDSIIGDQKDYYPPSGVTLVDDDRRPDYIFNHLVIGAVNGSWGQLVKASPAVNDTVTVRSDCYALGKCYYKQLVCVNDKHVNLVAFVYDNNTKEVLQAEKIRIR